MCYPNPGLGTLALASSVLLVHSAIGLRIGSAQNRILVVSRNRDSSFHETFPDSWVVRPLAGEGHSREPSKAALAGHWNMGMAL